ncbi:MAG: MoxR family ATPase [Actinomycetota bacterium]|nr:MoxR family ATPase [Actinomycetota bacterium]
MRGVDYLPSREIATTVFLANRLAKPILVEGPAGTGKTELAKAISRLLSRELVRLQCYEGLDDAKAIYEWNYSKQLLRIQSAKNSDDDSSWNGVRGDIFTAEFLLERPLLHAISGSDPKVLLVDEVDRVEVETEALFLEVLSDFQVTIPEFGTIKAASMPMVILTSNNTRELSEALKRRCIFLYLGYPSREREKDILTMKVPGLTEALAKEISDYVAFLRGIDLKKAPSVSESIDWALTLISLGASTLENEMVRSTLNVLLKYQGDIDKAIAKLA